ncbi:MAG: histidine phosphatase family protein [Pseudomonadota bacterium]
MSEFRARGRIVIARHGRPALDRRAGPRLDWRQYCDWWDRYEAGGLADGQSPPAELIEAAAEADILFASGRLRAQQTAQLAAPGREAEIDPVFNEAPLPPPRLKRVKYLPKTWNILARAAWLRGHALDGESVGEARERAAEAAKRLHEAAAHGTVFLAAHGWFNRMLRPELKKLGWRCVLDRGDAYWSHRVYEFRG